MTLRALDCAILSQKAMKEATEGYPYVSDVGVRIIRAVMAASVATGECSYSRVREHMVEWNRSANDSNLCNGLTYLTGVGLLSRTRKGMRLRYTVTVMGMNLLKDIDKALRKLRI